MPFSASIRTIKNFFTGTSDESQPLSRSSYILGLHRLRLFKQERRSTFWEKGFSLSLTYASLFSFHCVFLTKGLHREESRFGLGLSVRRHAPLPPIDSLHGLCESRGPRLNRSPPSKQHAKCFLLALATSLMFFVAGSRPL